MFRIEEVPEVEKRYCVWTPGGFVKAAADGSPEPAERTWDVSQSWFTSIRNASRFVLYRSMVWFRIMAFDAEDVSLSGQQTVFAKWLADRKAGARPERNVLWYCNRSGKLPMPQHVIFTPSGFVYVPQFGSEAYDTENMRIIRDHVRTWEVGEALCGYKELCFRYIADNDMKDAVVLKRLECEAYEDEGLEYEGDVTLYWPPRGWDKATAEERRRLGGKHNLNKLATVVRLFPWRDDLRDEPGDIKIGA